MKKQIILTLFVLAHLSSVAQSGFADDFSDGDFTQNPEWSTPVPAAFKVNSLNNLQLNANSGGKAIISTQYLTDSNMVWQFYLQMDFAPSASNRAIIFLENSLDSSAVSKSFAITIGEDGFEDKIRFYRSQSGNIIGAPVFSAKNSFMVNNLVKMRIKVCRSAGNYWTLEADYSGGYAFQKEAEYKDPVNYNFGPTQEEFKIVTEFTATRKDKFYFDDFKVGKPEIDQTPPVALSVKTIDNINVELLFNETIDSSTSLNPLIYSILPGPTTIDSVFYALNRIKLHLAETLLTDSSYQIIIGKIADLNGNFAVPNTLKFRSAVITEPAEKYDVIINEIMADPIPQVALPKSEFIEIYNRSKKYINLKGWTIKDAGKTEYILPEYLLKPNKYLIISKRDAKIDFGKYGDTLNLPALFALDSGPEDLYLYDSKGQLSDELHYDTGTYKNQNKSMGGYSLERKNPQYPCLGTADFCASESPDGGTPGKQNSVYNSSLTRDTLKLLAVFPTDSTTLLLKFDQTPDLASINSLKFSGNLKADRILSSTQNTEIQLKLKQPLLRGRLYELICDSLLKDCVGNASLADTFGFGLPEKASKGDLLINELLFNPRPGEYDFIEIYNNSEKAINLKGMYIANEKDGNSRSEIMEDFLLMPSQYAMISENPYNIALNYKCNSRAMLKNALPSLPDNEGNISIYFADGPGKRTIDRLDYDSKWHYPLLKDQDGVSLERLYFNYPTQDQNNWGSAASVSGFATPGYTNSQHIHKQEGQADDFYAENRRMSPDNDGFEDFLLIHYRLEPNTNAEISIFDLNGYKVSTLIQNETLQTEGEIRWDGVCDDGSRAKAGLYTVAIEYFRPDGTTRKKYMLLTVVYKI